MFLKHCFVGRRAIGSNDVIEIRIRQPAHSLSGRRTQRAVATATAGQRQQREPEGGPAKRTIARRHRRGGGLVTVGKDWWYPTRQPLSICFLVTNWHGDLVDATNWPRLSTVNA